MLRHMGTVCQKGLLTAVARSAPRARPGTLARSPISRDKQVTPQPEPFPAISKAKSRGYAMRLLGLLGASAAVLVFEIVAPIGMIAVGVVLLGKSASSEAAANAYRAAPPCSATVASASCFTLERGIITRAEVSHGKSGDTTDLDIRLVGRTESTWVSTSFAAEDALQVGIPVTVKLYHGQITLVTLPGFRLTARDNPTRVQQDERLGGYLFIGIGVLFGSALPIAWLKNRKRPTGYINLGLPVSTRETQLRQQLASRFGLPDPASAEALSPTSVVLPYTLRPQAAPRSGRSWWIAPIALVVGFPLIALRLRAPALVVLVTLVISASAASIGVVLHSLYIRNRRVVVDDLNVTQVDLWGRQRSVARPEISRIAISTLSSFSTGLGLEPRILLLANNGRCLMALPRYHIPGAQASELAAVLRVPVDSGMPRILSRKEMGREFPGSLTWTERHVVLVNLLLAPATLALLVLFVWAANGFK